MELTEAIIHAREVAGGCSSDNRDCAYQHDKLADWLEELQRYKCLEEQGRLSVLPCKIGDTVWFIGTECDKSDCWDYGDYCHRGCKKWKIPKVRKTTIRQFRLLGNQFNAMTDTTALASTTDNYFYLRDIGKTVFLTREEAEAALNEVEVWKD